MEGTCHFRTIWLLVPSAIAHIITDIALLGFPVPLIRKLDMHRSQKNMLTAIFAMGGLYVDFFFTVDLGARTEYSR